ncbi:diguanylate cyclase domain-containing protein [Methylibium petroleiphilum]|uniref:diguanylate cyclase domain-containing protein n=1 Tax=Methylibium petroleiphilum TaxID=105560 RepID=UPI001ACE8010|nr:diguanylate cyclase [Methylibium petroleiphilum]MBN9205294.1 diguanylate cyclase [Methylibium petroleiphilum]
MQVEPSSRWAVAFGSLKFRLALAGLLLISLSVGMTGVFVLNTVAQRTERTVIDSERSAATKTAAVLSARVATLLEALHNAARAFPVHDAGDADAMVRYLESNPILLGLFSGFHVAAPNGRLMAVADGHLVRTSDITIADRAYFRRVLADRRPSVSDAFISRVSGEPVLVLSMPVFTGDGQVAAMLGGVLRLTSRDVMADLTESGYAAGDPTSTIVVDGGGRIVSHSERRWILREASTEPHIAGAVAAWTAKSRPIEPQGSATFVDGQVVAMAGVPEAGWMVMRSASADTLFGGIATARRHTAWIALAVAVVGSGVILLLTLVLLRPLRCLEARAKRLLDEDVADEEGWPEASGELGRLSRIFQHVMRQRAASQTANDELLAKMQAVLGNAPAGIAFTRLGRFELLSAEFNRLFGYGEGELASQPTRLICLSDEQHVLLGQRVAEAFEAGRSFDEEIELVRKDGTRFWARRHGSPVRAGDISAGTIWVFTDITAQRMQRERLSWSASHDGLTDLVNRREFELRLQEQLRERRESERACVLFIDLDRFKAVNDRAGHAAGDELLRRVAGMMGEGMRAQDTVARLGGDEFAVLLRGCAKEAAMRIAQRIRARIAAFRLEWEGESFEIGASIGLVEIEDGLADVAAVMAIADAACYEAKRNGRNAVGSRTEGRLSVVRSSEA